MNILAIVIVFTIILIAMCCGYRGPLVTGSLIFAIIFGILCVVNPSDSAPPVHNIIKKFKGVKGGMIDDPPKPKRPPPLIPGSIQVSPEEERLASATSAAILSTGLNDDSEEEITSESSSNDSNPNFPPLPDNLPPPVGQPPVNLQPPPKLSPFPDNSPPPVGPPPANLQPPPKLPPLPADLQQKPVEQVDLTNATKEEMSNNMGDIEFGRFEIESVPPSGLQNWQIEQWKKRNKPKGAPFQELKPGFSSPFIDNRPLETIPNHPTTGRKFPSVNHYYLYMKYALKYNPDSHRTIIADYGNKFYKELIKIKDISDDKVKAIAQRLEIKPSEYWKKPKIDIQIDEPQFNVVDGDDEWGEETDEQREEKLRNFAQEYEQKRENQRRISPVASIKLLGRMYPVYLRELVMLAANKMKFSQQQNLKNLLKKLNNLQFYGPTPWGGETNMLGKMLTQLKSEI